MDKLDKLGKEAVEELRSAEKKFAGFNSAHEGYAVLLEEVDELWDAVKLNPKKIEVYANSMNRLDAQREEHYKMMRSEAVQVAAMGLRFMKFLDENYEHENYEHEN